MIRRMVGALVVVAVAGSVGWAEDPVATAAAGEEAAAPAFSFLQVSDSHFGPALSMPADLAGERGWATWRALAAHEGPMALVPYGIEAPPPEFVVHTGDVVEYGFPGATTPLAAEYYVGVDLPAYEVAGNHDNTWVADTGRWRSRHGGLNHSWEHGGIRFIALNSATIQDPLPSFGEETVAWLAELLPSIDRATPIVLLWHHPSADSTFASRYDKDRVFDLVRDHNVAAVLVGHSHAVRTEVTYGLPAVHGGSSFGKNSGYAVADVRDRRLRMAYRPLDEDAATTPLLDVSLVPVARPRLEVLSPAPWQAFPGGEVTLEARAHSPAGVSLVRAHAEINDTERVELALAADATARGSFDSGRVLNGAHYVRFVFEEDDATTRTGVGQHTRSVAFTIDDPNRIETGTAQWRTALGASIQSTPTLFEGRVYVGDNAGRVTALEAETGAVLARHQARGEVLADVVAWRPNPAAPLRLVVGTGAGELLVLDENLKPTATFQNEHAIYSTAAIDADGVAYVGTNGGDVVAVRVETGELVWRATDPDYSIEVPVTLAGDRVIVGAWDGNLYAFNRADGSLAWKSPGPRNATEGVNRYYAPGDVPPVVIGDSLLVADRAYKAGRYTLADGVFGGTFAEGVAALGAAIDGNGVVARRLDKPVALYGLDGKERWSSSVVAGRNPVVPTTNGRAYFVVDQGGRLAAINARNGATVWEYQVTPGQYVFAAPTPVEGGVYTAGMDGRVTYIRRNTGQPRGPRRLPAEAPGAPAAAAGDSPTSAPVAPPQRRSMDDRPGQRRFRFGRPSPSPAPAPLGPGGSAPAAPQPPPVPTAPARP